jgi:hypothetical protein
MENSEAMGWVVSRKHKMDPWVAYYDCPKSFIGSYKMYEQ